jgi:hypothetical protein
LAKRHLAALSERVVLVINLRDTTHLLSILPVMSHPESHCSVVALKCYGFAAIRRIGGTEILEDTVSTNINKEKRIAIFS